MNMKTIMNKNKHQLLGALFGICAVLFAVVLFAVPAQVSADHDDFSWEDAGYYDYNWEDAGYYDYNWEDAGYYDTSYNTYDTYYTYDTPTYQTYDTTYTSCSTCGGYTYSTPTYTYTTPTYQYTTPTYTYTTPTYTSTPTYTYTTPTYTYNTPTYTSTPNRTSVNTPTYTYTTSDANARANSASNSTATVGDLTNTLRNDLTNTNTNNNADNTVNTNTNTSTGGNATTGNNTNTNTATGGNSTNTNNNGNNITIVLNTTGGTQNTTPTPIDGYCVISPSTVYVNQDVTLTASASGGNGSYTYSWTGTDGIYSSSQSFTGRFSSIGTKTATVTIMSGGQSISRSCNVNVQAQNQYSNLSAYCVANPSVSNIGQTVTWTAYVSGGNTYGGNYSYSWNGTDGLYGNNQSVYMNYNSFGTKTANVTVYANGQTVNASCSMTVQGQAAGLTVIRTPDQGTPVSGVYLSQIPSTGIDFNMKTVLFVSGLALWSAFMAYYMINRRKGVTALAGVSGSTSSAGSVISKASAFKLSNMQKRGIVA